MRLASLEAGGRAAPSVVLENGDYLRLDLAAAAAGLSGDVRAAFEGEGLVPLIATGPAALDAARKLAGSPAEAARVPAGSARLLAPIPRPSKNVFCVGRNYAEHIAEGERAQNIKVGVSDNPVFFTKPPATVIGHGAPAPHFENVTQKFDYEVELAIVIGKGGRDIPKERAMEHVFGYTIANDLTARDIQRTHGGQFFKGKALDGSCPLGPWIVTADALPDAAATGLRLWVNGEKRQDGNTRDMIFDMPTLIASLSAGLTLEPGDIIATGTPSGVGYAMEPPVFLKHGDVVVCEIDGIGRLETPIRSSGAAMAAA